MARGGYKNEKRNNWCECANTYSNLKEYSMDLNVIFKIMKYMFGFPTELILQDTYR